ncbi:MAG: GNAT family N-acetyltransferase [Actinomycetota bacterium]|nr:GNAT family N-acetyltransferase [Actinomycetota bacterium]
MRSAIAVDAAQKHDVPALSRVLGRAFFDDPVMTWMLPEDKRRAAALPRMFAAMVRHHYLAGGGVEVAHRVGEVGAAALWDPPGRWRQTQSEELRMMPGLLLALGRRAGRGMAVSELMKSHHPDEPHWYLGVIGSDPQVRGVGFGKELMLSRLSRCDAEGAPCYLESTKESNVAYYMRYGFDVTGELALPDGGPGIWQMWRPPR